MKRIRLLLFLGLLATAQSPAAQSAPAGTFSSGRYLFIVETSAAMRGRVAATQETVHDLIVSDMGGQLRPGDTLGLWTFNESLYAGRFPLQLWTASARSKIAGAIVGFLGQQRYEKTANLQKVLPELKRVIASSHEITVLLIVSGEAKIVGTPYDTPINTVCAQWRREMQRTRMPIVIVLRARDGQFTGYTVNMVPWPVEFPPFPPQPKPVSTSTPAQIPTHSAGTAQTPKKAAPIILDMSKPKPAPESQTAQFTAVLTNQDSLQPPPARNVTASITNQAETSTTSEKPQVSPVTVEAKNSEPPTATSVSEPVSSQLTAPKANVAVTSNDQPDKPGPQLHDAKSATSLPVEPPELVQPAEQAASVLTNPLSQQPLQSLQRQESCKLESVQPANPPNDQELSLAPLTAEMEPLNQILDSPSQIELVRTASSASLPRPVQAAVSAPAATINVTKLLLIAMVAVGAAVGCIFFWHRTRSPARPSLITRAMDRKQP